MTADRLHLVRHGEVHNPGGVLYGRLPGFRLSELGRSMTEAAAAELVATGRPVTRLVASPLQRTQESAEPVARAFDLPIETDPRLIEPTNRFEGKVVRDEIRKPINWPMLAMPWRPGWGEPYRSLERRMLAAVSDAFDSVPDGDVVLVSHQLPIWVVHLSLAGERFLHDPRARRCNLSSITSLERRADGTIVEVGYADPAAALQADATDVGAA